MIPENHSYDEAVEFVKFNTAKATYYEKLLDKIAEENAILSSECDSKEVPITLLMDIALQYSEDDDDDDDWEASEICGQAFECLEAFATKLPFNFYQDYYLMMKKRIKPKPSEIAAIKKLDNYMKSTSEAEKYRILRTLTTCLLESVCGVEISIFNQFHSSAWGKELLMYALLSNNITWDVKQVPDFVKEMGNLNAFIKENSKKYCIENVLEILIKAQNACQLDIRFIIKIVKLLRSNVKSLDVISRDFCSLLSIIDELETLRLTAICDQRKILYTDEKQLVKFHNLLLYSEETVDSILGKVKHDTKITELIDLFETLKNNELIDKEEYLRQLTPNKNIHTWKKELYFPLIQTFICREFPRYHCHLSCTGFFIAPKSADVKNFSDSNLAKKESCTNYCEFDETAKEELNQLLENPVLGLILAQMLHDLNHKLSKLLLKWDWSDKTLKIIEMWIKCLDDKRKVTELIAALDILIDYYMDITEDAVSKLISNSTLTNVQNVIHKYVIDKTFPGTYEKSLDQLIDELTESNANEGDPLLGDKNLLREKYDKVMAAYETGTSKLISSQKKIKDWSVSDIEEWINPFTIVRYLRFFKPKKIWDDILPSEITHYKYIQESTTQYEIIAVIKRAMQLISGINVRDIQLLSVIMLVNSETSKGRLAQINTGEGKTTIIAMIAAYHTIRGNRVDIITSSSLLAIPQSKQQSKFYRTLGITVAHNCNSGEAYLSDIVYGTSQTFQGDILRDEFRKSGIRHGRKFEVAIVDEVDNMLVDGNNHIVMLSSYMPAMDHLEPILAAIYMQIKTATESIIEKDGQTYFVDQENAVDDNGEVKNDVVVNLVPIEGTKREFIEKCTERHIRQLIRDGDTSSIDKNLPEIKIPNHLRELICKVALKNWINEAFSSLFYYRKDEEYILVKDVVKVVDAYNTGVVQPDMRLSNGLHQFLQIKHGARITPERLITNFMSNVTFFQRYRPKLYGLSGTLGSNGTKILLNKTYGVDTVIVPPFKLKQHKELEGIVVSERNDWYRAIVRSCLRKLNNGRAVLVIMEYIRETELLKTTFIEELYDKKKLKLYKTNADSAVVDTALKPGDVIITTNIAGRGTDIKLSKDVDENGGLHVCLTFMPNNSRVEQQNTGRTSRTGNRGTSQFVLLNSENDIGELRNRRMEKDEATMRSAETEIGIVTTKDIIFQKFCRLIDKISGRNEFVREIEKKAVEERFAIWLKMNDDKISEGLKDDALKDFESFEEELLNDDRNNNLIRNPYMHVKIGNKYLNKKKYEEAINEYSSAIQLDSNFAEHAYYNRGYAYIARYGGDVTGNKYFIEMAVNDMEKARALIEDREHCLHIEQSASDGKVFSEKIRNKLNLYNMQKNAIEVAIGPDLDAVNAQLEQLEKDKNSEELTSKEKEEIVEAIESMNKLKTKDGVIQTARSKGKDVTIQRHLLKECLPDDTKSYRNEIREFEENGAIGYFVVSEIPPIDWKAVFALLAIGFAQLIVGSALMVFTLGGGASFGMGLITEGISDIITAVRDGIINRSFSWATWAIEKAISLTISVVCAGYKAMKDVAKTSYAGTKTAASIFSKGLTETTKSGWRIVGKKIGFELAKGVGKSIANELINLGINKTLIPLIQQAIIDEIKGPIEQALLDNGYVKTMLELDEQNNNQYYESRIKIMGYKILNPARNTDLLNIAQRIATGIADQKISGLANIRMVSTALVGVVQLTTFTDRFINKLNSSIEIEANKDKIHEKLSDKSESEVNREDKQCAIISYSSSKESGEDIDLNSIDNNAEQVELQREKRGPESISNEFVKVVATRTMNIIQGKMIAPLVQYGVNYTADKLTAAVDASISMEMETYRSHKRVIYHQNKGFSEKKKKEKESKKKRTVEEWFAINKVNEVIDDARNGGPSGLVHLGAASDVIGKPVEVYDEKGRPLYTIGEGKQGDAVKVQFHKGESGDTVGHYTMLGGHEPTNNAGGQNLCLYNVISEQTGHNPEHLKHLTLTTMEENKEQMAKQANDIAHLQIYGEMKLAIGGAIYTGECPNDAGIYLQNSNGAKTYRTNNTGHNNLHYPHKNNWHRWKAVAEETGRQVVIGVKSGDHIIWQPPIGNKSKKPPILFEYHGNDTDKSKEYYTSIDGKEVYRLNDPLDKTFYKIIAKQINHPDASQLASNVRNRITDMKISKKTHCLENAMQKDSKKTGYISETEMNFVMHHALQTKKAKGAMAELNKYKPGIVDGEKQRRQVVILSKAELGLPRDAYATGMREINGKLVQCVWPVDSIKFLLQHHDNQQGNPNAPVFIHTTMPLEPGNKNVRVEGNEWGPANKKDWR